MKKIEIQNRKNQKIVMILEEQEDQKGLAFVMHGLGGFKEQAHIQVMADVFKKFGYTVVRFDTTNTFGESDGNYEQATVTNYYEDLEDVVEWAKMQEWYQEPFALAGHSLGGICVGLFAEKHPKQVKALAPIGTVVSGELSLKSPARRETNQKWKVTGWREKESESKPGVIKRLPWSHMEDRLRYDLLREIDSLTMPVFMLVGSEDTSTIPEHQKILFDALPEDKKELHIIDGAPHTFREQSHLDEFERHLTQWVENYSEYHWGN